MWYGAIHTCYFYFEILKISLFPFITIIIIIITNYFFNIFKIDIKFYNLFNNNQKWGIYWNYDNNFNIWK